MNLLKQLLIKAGWLIRGLVILLTVVSGLAVLVMMLVTCTDVILRAFKHPLVGALDIVSIASAIAITCALPYTTAVKGHVAIEYFFQKFNKKARVVVDTFSRVLGILLFSALTWQSIHYGLKLLDRNQVTSTLQIPIFWIPFVMAFSCAVVTLVILQNLLHPGKEMIKP